MGKNIGKLVALVVALAMVFGLAACGGSVESAADSSAPAAASSDAQASAGGEASADALPGEGLTIGMYVPLIGHPYFMTCQKGAEQAAVDLGFNLIWTGPAVYDSAEEIAMISDLISQEVDILIVSPGDAAGVASVLNEATAAGIVVLCFDQDSPTSDRVFCVSAGNSEITGRIYAEVMAEAIGNAGQIAITTGTFGADALDRRINAAKATLEQWPDIEVVAVEANEEDAEKGVSQCENLMQTYPDLKGFICVASTGCYFAAQAVSAAGMSGQIKIVGMGMPTQCSAYIKDGTITSAMLWDPAKMTYIAAAAAIDYLKNGTLPTDGQDFSWGGKLAVDSAAPYIGYVDDITFTPENVDDYAY